MFWRTNSVGVLLDVSLVFIQIKDKAEKSLGLPLTNYNINPHQHVSELFCILDVDLVDPYRVSQSVSQSVSHCWLPHYTPIPASDWDLVLLQMLSTKTKANQKLKHLTPQSPSSNDRSLLAILLVKPNFLLLFFWGIIWTTEAHFTYFVLSGFWK